VVTGDARAILDEMLAHEAVEVVAFTGSVAVGRELAARAGYRRTILELGGNDPLLVLRDADVDQAAALAVAGATQNSGQRCTAVKRVLVEGPLADALAERIVRVAAALRVGDPLHEQTQVRTLIDARRA